MAARPDQMQAHQFLLRRVVSALVSADPDPRRPPLARVGAATLIGVLLASLGVAATLVYTVVSPGAGGRWRDQRAIIVERESGTLFVYRDQRLHPVANQVSARLILGEPEVRTILVTAERLRGVPRGVPLGITGAPPALPARERLHRGPWSVCTHHPGGAAASGESVLLLGAAGEGGAALGDRGLLITARGQVHLIWHDRRHLVRQPEIVLPALVWTTPPWEVDPAALQAIPAGADVVAPVVPGLGAVSGQFDGSKIGQVYWVQRVDGARDLFVLTLAGLRSVTRLQAELLLADPALGQPQPVPLARQDLARYTGGAPVPPLAPNGLPADVPALVDAPTGALCAPVPPSDSGVLVGVRLPPAGGRPAGALVDRVVVRPGTGAVVRSADGPVMLVTESGVRYPLSSAEVLPALGYGGVEPLTLPADVLALLPTGPVLDPAVAKQPT